MATTRKTTTAASKRTTAKRTTAKRTTAKKTPDGGRLDGHKTAVLDGNAAGQIIVSARVDDGKLCLFLVPKVIE